MHEALSIALFTHSVNPRGGVVHTLELAEALRKKGHKVTIFATARPGQQLFREVAVDVVLIILPATPCDNIVDEIGVRIATIERHLAASLATQRFDVLHAQDPISANALANLRERGYIDRFVRTVHHLDTFDSAQLSIWQARGHTSADLVLCVSTLWQAHFQAVFGRQTGLVNNGVHLARYAPHPTPGDDTLYTRLGIRRHGKVIVSIGGIEERKNPLRLLQAFILLKQQHAAVQLVIAGGASLLDHRAQVQAFTQLLDEHGIATGPQQDVVITGPLDDDDIPRLLRIADVTAMPSIREGFGLVVIESLACGTPVVVSRIRPFTDYLQEEDVFWADPYDPDAIARALGQALVHADAAKVASSAARLAACFDWDVSAQQHLDYYMQGVKTGVVATVPTGS